MTKTKRTWKTCSKCGESFSAHRGETIEKMTKRPFGCVFVVGARKFTLKMTASGQYSYKRIA